MGLTNARYYNRGRFFWDERAATLEDQVVTPIQDTTEMGMNLTDLEAKLAATDFYPALFRDAFGTTQVTQQRIARALAQFVRSMSSYRSKYDSAFVNGTPNFAATFTPQEERGRQIFTGVGRCDVCHLTDAHISPNVFNNGLDATVTDVGAGGGRFKSPSLRNVAVRAPTCMTAGLPPCVMWSSTMTMGFRPARIWPGPDRWERRAPAAEPVRGGQAGAPGLHGNPHRHGPDAGRKVLQSVLRRQLPLPDQVRAKTQSLLPVGSRK